MRELGYVEGRNLVIETRFGDGRIERLGDLATELLQLSVDVIVATGGPVYGALKQAGTTIPVVITVTNDPLVVGLAASLSRPGGYFTGLTDTAENLGPKQLELLLDAVPRLAHVGVLLNPDNASHRAQMKLLMLAAQKVRVRVVRAQAGTVEDIEPAFAALVRERADAVILFGDTFFTQQFHQIAQAALTHRLPSISLAQNTR
jgi:putative ABC transport system substrate-binding protein